MSLRYKYLIICFAILSAGCEDDTVPRDYPRVRTLEVANITEAGAIFSAEIYEPGNVEITDHGFTWDLSVPNIDQDNRVFLGGFTGIGKFSSEINTSLQDGLTYKVTAFVKAGDYTVYGNTVEFKSLGSLGPEITGFSPERVICGDTVTITGRNFSWVNTFNQVRFNEVRAFVCGQASDTILKVVVPFELQSSENLLSVEITGNRTTFPSRKIKVDLPEVVSAVPDQAYWGDTVTLNIKNLHKDVSCKLLLEKLEVTPYQTFDGEKLRFIVPDALQTEVNKINVSVPNRIFSPEFTFRLLPPVIESFTPLSGNWSSIITVYGHFNGNLSGSTVSFGNISAFIQSHSRDSIKLTIPPALSAGSTISYKYGSFRAESVQPFSFLLPEIESVTPLSEYVGGTVTITGRNFSPQNTAAKFGNITATNISVTGNQVRCYVPGNLSGPVDLTVRSGVQETVFPEKFLLTNPAVISFFPESGTLGDTVLIKCANLLPGTLFTIGNYTLANISSSHDTVKAWLKLTLFESGLLSAYISRNNNMSSYVSNGQSFIVRRPEIHSFSPASGKAGTTVTIKGDYFSKVPSYNYVYVNGIYAPHQSATQNEIVFRMPSISRSDDYTITVAVGGMKTASVDKFSYTSAWTRLPDLPGGFYKFPYGFPMKFGNEVVVAVPPGSDYYEKILYLFDSSTGTFSRLNDSVYRLPFYEASVINKGSLSYLLGYGDGVTTVYSFDFASQTFEKVSDFPGEPFRQKVFLDGDSVLYVGGGRSVIYKTDFWKYNINTGRWTRLKDIVNYSSHGHEFSVGEHCYVVTDKNITYEYNPVDDTWLAGAAYSGINCNYTVDVECDGMIYMGFGSCDYSSLNRYDPVGKVWTGQGHAIESNSYYLNFSLNSKIYIGGGQGGPVFWEYDPALGVD